jgi:hypothetical protein
MQEVTTVCTCSKSRPGKCRSRETQRRRVRLSDELIREEDWGGGFAAALTAAAHTWYGWAFPHHGQEMCDKFNYESIIKYIPDRTWRIYVFDAEDQMWVFETGPLDPDDFDVADRA